MFSDKNQNLPVPDSVALAGNNEFFVPRERQASGTRSCPPPAPRKLRPSSRLSAVNMLGEQTPQKLAELPVQFQNIFRYH